MSVSYFQNPDKYFGRFVFEVMNHHEKVKLSQTLIDENIFNLTLQHKQYNGYKIVVTHKLYEIETIRGNNSLQPVEMEKVDWMGEQQQIAFLQTLNRSFKEQIKNFGNKPSWIQHYLTFLVEEFENYVDKTKMALENSSEADSLGEMMEESRITGQITPYPRYSSVAWSINDNLLIVKNEWMNQPSISLTLNEKEVRDQDDLDNFFYEQCMKAKTQDMNSFMIKDEKEDEYFLQLYKFNHQDLQQINEDEFDYLNYNISTSKKKSLNQQKREQLYENDINLNNQDSLEKKKRDKKFENDMKQGKFIPFDLSEYKDLQIKFKKLFSEILKEKDKPKDQDLQEDEEQSSKIVIYNFEPFTQKFEHKIIESLQTFSIKLFDPRKMYTILQLTSNSFEGEIEQLSLLIEEHVNSLIGYSNLKHLSKNYKRKRKMVIFNPILKMMLINFLKIQKNIKMIHLSNELYEQGFRSILLESVLYTSSVQKTIQDIYISLQNSDFRSKNPQEWQKIQKNWEQMRENPFPKNLEIYTQLMQDLVEGKKRIIKLRIPMEKTISNACEFDKSHRKRNLNIIGSRPPTFLKHINPPNKDVKEIIEPETRQRYITEPHIGKSAIENMEGLQNVEKVQIMNSMEKVMKLEQDYAFGFQTTKMKLAQKLGKEDFYGQEALMQMENEYAFGYQKTKMKMKQKMIKNQKDSQTIRSPQKCQKQTPLSQESFYFISTIKPIDKIKIIDIIQTEMKNIISKRLINIARKLHLKGNQKESVLLKKLLNYNKMILAVVKSINKIISSYNQILIQRPSLNNTNKSSSQSTQILSQRHKIQQQQKKQHPQLKDILVYCYICRIRILGIALFCDKCRHGGHIKCVQQWFSQKDEADFPKCPKCFECYCFQN